MCTTPSTSSSSCPSGRPRLLDPLPFLVPPFLLLTLRTVHEADGHWFAVLAEGLSVQRVQEASEHRARVGPLVDRIDHHGDGELLVRAARAKQCDQELTEAHVHELHEVQERVVAKRRVDDRERLCRGHLAVRPARGVGLETGRDRAAGTLDGRAGRLRLGLCEAEDAVGRGRPTLHLQVEPLVVPAVLGELRERLGEKALGALLFLQPVESALEPSVGIVVPLDDVAPGLAPPVHSARLPGDAFGERVVVERARAGGARARLDVCSVVVWRLWLVDDVCRFDVQADRSRQIHGDEADDEPVLVQRADEHFIEIGLAAAHHVVGVQHAPLVVVRVALVDVVQVGLEGGLVVPGVEHPLVHEHAPVGRAVRIGKPRSPPALQ
eukprot:5827948-Pleurochrysis_carterae.AAC.2